MSASLRRPGFTLRTHAHLLPTSEDRAREASDAAFGEDQAAEDIPEALDGLIMVQRPSGWP
ncbi:hypothetical protein AB0B48_13670 [Micromonospora sp. NPDC049089]|uniref:hypothetical protein n=1 Tax=unclassified Micromonospora TaxID=2617518 RepID=UPI0033E72666